MPHEFDFNRMFLFGGTVHWVWPLLFWILVIIAIISAIKWLSMSNTKLFRGNRDE